MEVAVDEEEGSLEAAAPSPSPAEKRTEETWRVRLSRTRWESVEPVAETDCTRLRYCHGQFALA